MNQQPDPAFFRRQDESPDTLFYTVPRLVTHIDDHAIGAVRELYDEILPEGGAILDLMSSWVSHLPENGGYSRVVGLGMNAEELRANPRLDDFTVHDLNADPTLPYADGAFDGCVCTVSVQYMTRPVEIFREVNRVLRPASPFVLTFSNRCFPTKAVAAWRATGDAEHGQLVAAYFHASGGWGEVYAQDRSPRARGADPLYGVWAWKQGEGRRE